MIENLTLFVFWQDPVTRRWHVVGRLTKQRAEYRFVYTKGALASKHFVPFGSMNELYREYESTRLLPFFSNRVLQKSRPEYTDYLEWLGLGSADPDPLVQLARTGGLKGTDSLSMYPAPTPDENGNYRAVFFCHGIRYIVETALGRIEQLRPGDTLYPLHDMQNEWDQNALALRSSDPATLVGYCPRFFAKDYRTLLRKRPKKAKISVIRVNPKAPIEYRLLCKFESPWPKGFRPCQGGEYLALESQNAPPPTQLARNAE